MPLIYNSETRKSRNGAFQRFQDGPAAVYKVREPYNSLSFTALNFNLTNNRDIIAWTLWSLLYRFASPASVLYSVFQHHAFRFYVRAVGRRAKWPKRSVLLYAY